MKSRANWRFWHRKGENRQNEGAKGPHPEPEFITIVSGLPRSGTSMLMRMLEAGGMKILADGLREADENNPNGYFELESVKKLLEVDYSWIDGTWKGGKNHIGVARLSSTKIRLLNIIHAPQCA